MSPDYIPAKVPVVGDIISVILQMSTFGVLCFCLTRRTQYIKNWKGLPLAIWLVLSIYVDSTLFVFATSIVVHGLGINSSREVCEGGILLCLVCYMSTKILIYYFLVERAYIVRGTMKSRFKSKLWLFNCLFMLLPYAIFVIMNFIFRITYINEKGMCIIGMKKIAMMPLIIFEVIVNVYLTLLFIIPLRGLYSYKQNANQALNRMAFRSFVGSCATLTTSVVNLTILMVLKGEPGWICLMCCNADILFCVLVLHWVTNREHKEESSGQASRTNNANATIGSKSRSRRMSLQCKDQDPKLHAVDDKHIEAQSGQRVSPFDKETEHSQDAIKHPATIVTECKSGSSTKSLRRGLHRSPASWEIGRREDDEVELNNIRVQTVHTREVEIDVTLDDRMRGRAGEDEGDWISSQRRVVGQRMV